MKITFSSFNDTKTVQKPWGFEKWIAGTDPDSKFALKEIHFKAPHRTSLQFHKIKEETEYFISGKGIFHYYPEPLDILRYENGEYSHEELEKIKNNLLKKEIVPGLIIHVKRGCIHRVEALDDMVMLEASTTELDDIIRLDDDSKRPDGKIDDEHLN